MTIISARYSSPLIVLQAKMRVILYSSIIRKLISLLTSNQYDNSFRNFAPKMKIAEYHQLHQLQKKIIENNLRKIRLLEKRRFYRDCFSKLFLVGGADK